jgi:hypothetical protein
MDYVVDFVFRYVLPTLGVAGIVVLWAKWDIDKRRMRVQRRQQLVNAWRAELLPKLQGDQVLGRGTEKYPFMRTPEYASLRPYLKAELLAKLEDPTTHINVHQKDGRITVIGDFPRKEIIEEIARIERGWKLV